MCTIYCLFSLFVECSKEHTWPLQQVTVKHLLPCLVWELDSLGAVATYSDHWSAYEGPVSILVHIQYVYCCITVYSLHAAVSDNWLYQTTGDCM